MTSALSSAGSTKRWRRIRAAVLYRDDNVCRWCGGHATHVDHLVPRSRGGSDDPTNLVASCARCNQTRGAGPAAAPPSRPW